MTPTDGLPYLENNQYFSEVRQILNPYSIQSERENITLTPNLPNSSEDDGLIKHEYLDILGSTTNILIYCLLDNSPNEEFTRVSIRESIERHVKALEKDKGKDSQHIARIQKGKAAINYWIDRMVENGTFDKKHTKPVKFWIKKKSIFQKNVLNQRRPMFWSMNNRWEY